MEKETNQTRRRKTGRKNLDLTKPDLSTTTMFKIKLEGDAPAAYSILANSKMRKVETCELHRAPSLVLATVWNGRSPETDGIGKEEEGRGSNRTLFQWPAT